VPSNAVSPKDKAYTDYLINVIPEIVTETGGKSFILFTSYNMLNQVFEATKDKLQNYDLLKQGQGNKDSLLKQYRNSDKAVLFGTDTFWEGVDEDINCVIITKLPFAVPTEPIEEARYEIIAKVGKNPFLVKSVPTCALKLKQGVGRLIRHSEKRGVIAILDPRIQANWGKPIVNTLPEMKYTRDIKAIGSMFKAIS